MMDTEPVPSSIAQYGLAIVFLFFSAATFAQPNRSATFHVSGTVMLFGSPMGDRWVTFEGPSHKSVKADPTGHYEADLPFGVWKVALTISSALRITEDQRLSHPRVFRVTKPMNVTIDLYVNGVGCDVRITPDGRPPTPEVWEHRNEACEGRVFFVIPSDDGVPFEVVIGGQNHDLCSFQPEKARAACEREFANYNLLTVYADRVKYTQYAPLPNGVLLEATGDVVIENEGRKYRKNSAQFLINDGQAGEVY